MLLASVAVSGAGAQDEGRSISISRVDSGGFPRVTASITITGGDDISDRLAAGDLKIAEDGKPVPAANVDITRTQSPRLWLVMAIDLSMNATSLEAVKAACRSFIDTLRPQDRAGVVAFYDEVAIVSNMTNNREVLDKVIDDLVGEGKLTALNAAAFQAVEMVAAAGGENRAVIVVTNSRDNTNLRSVDDLTSAAQTANTPLYLIGFDNAQQDDMDAVASATGGQAFLVADPEEVAGALKTVSTLLSKGYYDVTFESNLRADDAEHDLTVGLSGDSAGDVARSRFVASRHPLTVTVPALIPDSVVTGTLNLTAAITAPATVIQVQYLLDGTPLAEVTEEPYALQWDSATTSPGSHRLTVRAEDRVGNTGSAEAAITVKRPLMIRVPQRPAGVAVGQPLEVMVEVEPTDSGVRVDLMLGDLVVKSLDAPPYWFEVDTRQFTPGDQVITLRAADADGNLASTDVTVSLTAPEPGGLIALWRAAKRDLGIGDATKVNPLDVLIVLGALALIGAAFFGLVFVMSALRGRSRRVYRLELMNLGNIAAAYQLCAEEPSGALTFAFRLNGTRLLPKPEYVELEVVEPEPVAAADLAPVAAGAPARGAVSEAPRAAGQAVRTASEASSMLGGIGALLPGAAGSAMRQAARPVQQAQSTASSAMLRTQSRVGHVEDMASQVVGSRQAPVGTAAAPQAAAVPGGRPAGSRAATSPRRRRILTVDGKWIDTPVLRPNQRITLDLTVLPRRPDRPCSCVFGVMSRVVGLDDIEPLIEEAMVETPGIPWLLRMLPYAGFVLFVAGVIVVMASMLVNRVAAG